MSATCAIQFNHVGISVPDAEAAVEWYTTVFGMTVTRTTQCVEPDPDKGDETPMHKLYGKEIRRMKMAVLSLGNGQGFEIFQFEQPTYSGPSKAVPFGPDSYTRGGFFHISLTSKNPESHVKAAVANGGSILGEKFDLPRGQSAQFVQDPWGNAIELLTCSLDELFEAAS